MLADGIEYLLSNVGFSGSEMVTWSMSLYVVPSDGYPSKSVIHRLAEVGSTAIWAGHWPPLRGHVSNLTEAGSTYASLA